VGRGRVQKEEIVSRINSDRERFGGDVEEDIVPSPAARETTLKQSRESSAISCNCRRSELFPESLVPMKA